MSPQDLAAPQAKPDEDWWRGAVIYEIYPRSFQDSNGDGTGDLAGITRRLPYVAALGADAVWVAPFFRSPMKDFGYDVSAYTDVDPMFGTIRDFEAMVTEAHRLGLKVIMDLVLSHTSDQHPWFIESRSSRKNAKADWYVWADAKPDGTAPNNWLSIFGGQAWEWDTSRLQYYMHNFLTSQPDLNYHCPEVQDAIMNVARFWLDKGVDGFRLDTVNFYFHDKSLADNPPLPPERRNANTAPSENPYNYQDHLHDKSQPENLAFLRRFRSLLNEYGAKTTLGEVGESQRGREVMAAYTSGGDKVHMCYDFDFLAPDLPTPQRVREVIAGVESIGRDAWPCWAFSNHDTVRHVSRWGAADQPRRIKLYAALLLSLRGSVCLYQGEELALTEAHLDYEDVRDPYGLRLWPKFRGRDGARTPIPWEAGAPFAGFTEAPRPWLPLPPEHLSHAVDAQEGDAASVLNAYRRMLAFRRAHLPLAKGGMILEDCAAGLVVFTRRRLDQLILCAFNLTNEVQACPAPWAAKALSGHGFSGQLSDGSLILEPWDAFFGADETTAAAAWDGLKA